MKSWILSLLLWSVIVAVSLHHNWKMIDRHGLEVAANRARFTFRMVETIRLWNARHGGLYAPVSPSSPPNPYLNVPERDISTPSGLPLTRINPAYMTRQVADIVAETQDWALHITSLKPLNPGNKADAWEAKALRDFETNDRKEVIERITEPGLPEMFRYMAPLKVKQACLACHAGQGCGVGDVRGGISVSFPVSQIESIVLQQKQHTLLLHLVTWLLLSGLILVLKRRIERHMAELKDARDNQESLVQMRTKELQEEVKVRQKAEGLLRSVTDAAIDAIISADTHGHIKSWNRGATLLFGYDEAEVLGEPLTLLMPERYRADHEKGLQRAYDTGEMKLTGQIVELAGLRKDGSEFPMEVSLASWSVYGKRYFSSVIRDITERKRVGTARL